MILFSAHRGSFYWPERLKLPLLFVNWCVCLCICWCVCVSFRSIDAVGWCLKSHPVKDRVAWRNIPTRRPPTSEPVRRWDTESVVQSYMYIWWHILSEKSALNLVTLLSIYFHPPPQVTEISNVKSVTRLPRDTKRQAVAIVFTDDTSRTFTCESGNK